MQAALFLLPIVSSAEQSTKLWFIVSVRYWLAWETKWICKLMLDLLWRVCLAPLLLCWISLHHALCWAIKNHSSSEGQVSYMGFNTVFWMYLLLFPNFIVPGSSIKIKISFQDGSGQGLVFGLRWSFFEWQGSVVWKRLVLSKRSCIFHLHYTRILTISR